MSTTVKKTSAPVTRSRSKETGNGGPVARIHQEEDGQDNATVSGVIGRTTEMDGISTRQIGMTKPTSTTQRSGTTTTSTTTTTDKPTGFTSTESSDTGRLSSQKEKSISGEGQRNEPVSQQRENLELRNADSNRTIVENPHYQRSRASKASSSRRRRELEAKVKRDKAAAVLAQSEYDLARAISDTSLSDNEIEHQRIETRAQVEHWVDRSMGELQREEAPQEQRISMTSRAVREREGDRTSVNLPVSPPRMSTDMQAFTTSFIQAMREVATSAAATAAPAAPLQQQQRTPAPKYISDLIDFNGDPHEWIAFKATFQDSSTYFSDIQNMCRIRRAVQGKAREAVRAILYTTTEPSVVMEALEKRFGRTRRLIKSEIANLERLPNLEDDARNLAAFSGTVNNTVTTICQMNKPTYLDSTEISEKVIRKLSLIIRFKWYEYRAEHEDTPILLSLSTFLNGLADKYETYEADANRMPIRTNHARSQPTRRIVQVHKLEDELSCESESQQELTSEEESSDEAGIETRTVAVAQTFEEVCLLCKDKHALSRCKMFFKMKIDERWDTVKRLHACFLCLSTKHRGMGCRRKLCGHEGCRGRHHRLLHRNKDKNNEKKETKAEQDQPTTKTPLREGQMMTVNTVGITKAYLKIVPVEVIGPRGSIQIHALLDEGSTVTLIDEKVAKELGARGPIESLQLNGIGGQRLREEQSQFLQLQIRGLHKRDANPLIAYTIKDISLPAQAIQEEDVRGCPHLHDIKMDLTYEFEKPKLLIGQDNIQLIYTRETREGDSSKPMASRTTLGWILHGRSIVENARPQPKLVNHLYVTRTRDEELELTIKNHFSIDSLGVAPRKQRSDPEQRALSILEKSTKQLPNGRYETGLLWRADNEVMPPSRNNALHRLIGIERKLRKDDQLNEEYRKQIKNLIDSNYAEEAPPGPTSSRTFYLPHFAVKHPQKGKIRLVFDAAQRVDGKCLNDALLTGPDLLQSLFGVLVRFREGPIAVMADIKEMFLRVQVREQDRDSQRFLWRENTNEEPKEYRMKSLIFGAASSPTTAIYVKNKNAQNFKQRFPAAVKAIESNFYMDDYLKSFHTEDEAKMISKQINEIHRAGGFHLRGWSSNAPSVIEQFPAELRNTSHATIGKQHEQEEKTLGLRWNLTTDALNFTLSLRNTPRAAIEGLRPPTKREATSAVMSVFDPLGLASPILIQGKVMLQNVWRTGISWDEPLRETEEKQWLRWLHELDKLQEINIPRCIARFSNEGELHTFCDSSEKSYGTAVYWRAQNPDGTIDVRLIAGKARVTPLKPVSIPRLELQAALLGCRLTRSIEQESELRISAKTFWTDARTVLSWIKSDPRTYKPFVAHRLAEIEDYTKPQQWRWVPTAHNVADDTTRGTPSSFNSNHRWFTGPRFLLLPPNEWPIDTSARTLAPTGEEKSKTQTSITPADATTELVHNDDDLLSSSHAQTILTMRPAQKTISNRPDPARFSSWNRLLRATARFYQAIQVFKSKLKINKENLNSINNIKKVSEKNKDAPWRPNKKRDKKLEKSLKTSRNNIPYQQGNKNYIPLTKKFLQQAQTTLIKQIQKESFKKEKSKLKSNQPLDKNSKLRRLTLELRNDVIYLSTRISSADYIPETLKKPIVLDGKHRLTQLLIKQYHHNFNHGNHQTVMNEIRQKYFVTSLRTTVRKIIRDCYSCRLTKNLPMTAPFGDLPPERLNQRHRPFTSSAVDYFGPMMITHGRRHEKRWGALFTCLTTRAVHIELASSLTADSMILALRRMSARRGTPETIMSDNGTNFCLANKQLREEFENLKKGDVVSQANEQGIMWKFLPPGAPSQGGAWERLVRSIKVALTTTLHERYPREEVLHTLLLEAEHTINSRPLTEVSLDPEDSESLTPNHFLIGCSNGTPPIGCFDDDCLVGPSTWRTAQRLADHFWTRWTKEYLPTLQPRYINGRAYNNPSPGDIVLIVDSSLPRNTWPRGEILTVHPGPDGKVRVVEVRTKTGVLRRPASRIVILVSTSSSPDSCINT